MPRKKAAPKKKVRHGSYFGNKNMNKILDRASSTKPKKRKPKKK